MKNFKTFFLLAALAAVFMSCQKDEVKGLAGTWDGEWGFDQDVPSHYERWELKKNGDMSAYEYDGDLYAKGSWSINGASFEVIYQSEVSESKYRFVGTYDETLGTIEGTWGLAPSATNRGTYIMTRD